MSRKLSAVRRASGFCSASWMRISTGIIASGTQTSGPATMAMIRMNRKAKGRSPSAVSVAEVKKSRSVSNSRSVLMRTPVEPAAPCSRAPTTRA